MTWAVLSLFALTSGAPAVQVVAIPIGGRPIECEVYERTASLLALNPSVRILRTAAGKKPPSAVPAILVEGAKYPVSLRMGASPPQSVSGIEAVDHAVRALWPPNYPPLARGKVTGSANPEALRAACRGDAQAAYAASGPALGPSIRAKVDPPPKHSSRPLLAAWAHATAARRAGKTGRAIALLKRVVSGLERGEIGPVWRRPPIEGRTPSHLQAIAEGMLIFEAGRFTLLDAASGETRWSRQLGKSEPEVVPVEGGLLLVTLETEVVALEGKSGKIIWRTKLQSPASQIVASGDRLLLAGSRELVALKRTTGAEIWKFDPLKRIIAGPIQVGNRIAIPADTTIQLVDPANGKRLQTIDLKNEISAPLLSTANGRIWALVGAEAVFVVDGTSGEVVRDLHRLPGVHWPPVLAGEQLVIAARRRRRPFTAYLDPNTKSGLSRIFFGGLPPLVALPNYEGVVFRQARPERLVAVDPLGRKQLWKLRLPGRLTALRGKDDVLVAAVGRSAFVYDRKNGRRVGRVDLDGRIIDILLGTEGGTAITEDGAVYGLPFGRDPRPTHWLRLARLDLARALLDARQPRNALRLADASIARFPNDVVALGLRAEALERLNVDQAVTAWMTVADAAAAADPLRTRANQTLLRLAGIERRVKTGKPIAEAAMAERTLVLRRGVSISAHQLTSIEKTAWGAQGKTLRFAPPKYLSTEGVRLSADGKKLAATTTATLAELGIIEQTATTIRLSGADGSKRFELKLPAPRYFASDTRHLLVATSSAGGTLEVLEATGTSARSITTKRPILGAWLSEGVALIRVGPRLLGYDLATGRLRFRAALPPRGSTPTAIAGGWIVMNETRIARILTADRGRWRAVRLASAPLAWAIAAGIPYFVSARGLHAVDARRGTATRGLGAFVGRTILGSREKLVTVEPKTGALTIIDAARRLAPQPAAK